MFYLFSLNDLFIALALSYLDSSELLRTIKNIRIWQPIIKKYGFMFNINTKNLKITDTDLQYFGTVNYINLDKCWNTHNITDLGLKHLTLVHCISLSQYTITDLSLQYLKKIHTLNLSYCKITDFDLEHLKCVYA